MSSLLVLCMKMLWASLIAILALSGCISVQLAQNNQQEKWPSIQLEVPEGWRVVEQDHHRITLLNQLEPEVLTFISLCDSYLFHRSLTDLESDHPAGSLLFTHGQIEKTALTLAPTIGSDNAGYARLVSTQQFADPATSKSGIISTFKSKHCVNDVVLVTNKVKPDHRQFIRNFIARSTEAPRTINHARFVIVAPDWQETQ